VVPSRISTKPSSISFGKYEGHDALMTMYRLRFSEQIDLITAEGLMKIWRPDQER
jgi:hypothetical protein